MAEWPAHPKYRRATFVEYRDHHDRIQRGTVRSIEATWQHGEEPLIIYTLSHPSYANRRCYRSEGQIIGRASLTAAEPAKDGEG